MDDISSRYLHWLERREHLLIANDVVLLDFRYRDVRVLVARQDVASHKRFNGLGLGIGKLATPQAQLVVTAVLAMNVRAAAFLVDQHVNGGNLRVLVFRESRVR